jgi:hypothetical protein
MSIDYNYIPENCNERKELLKKAKNRLNELEDEYRGHASTLQSYDLRGLDDELRQVKNFINELENKSNSGCSIMGGRRRKSRRRKSHRRKSYRRKSHRRRR